MSEGKDDFAERLRRIREARDGSSGVEASVPKGPRALKTPPKPHRRSSVPFLVGLGFVFACGAGLFLANAATAKLPLLATGSVEATAPGDSSFAQGSGFLGQILALVTGAPSASVKSPVDFLPNAPEGWFRITTRDVQDPDLIPTLQSQWPASQTGQSLTPLYQHPGFAEVVRLIETFAYPDTETTVLARKQTKAVYLHPNGQVLFVALDFRDKANALGPKDDPSGWTDAIVRHQEKDLGADEIIERTRLAGLEITNRTQPTGQSLVTRPIGTDIYAPNGFRIALALTDRVVMEIQGVSTPKTAETLIVAMDRPALQAHLD